MAAGGAVGLGLGERRSGGSTASTEAEPERLGVVRQAGPAQHLAVVVAKARSAFDEGDYRSVAGVVKHVVFADPTHETGKDLIAHALEQLDYQAETGP